MTADDFDTFMKGLDGPVTTGGAKPRADNGEGDVWTENTPAKKPQNTHPCLECNGTGTYRGHRVHQEKSHCFACKGKGYFLKSFADRMASRNKAAARKVKKLDDAKAAFMAEHVGLIEALRDIAGWHSFAATMLGAFDKWGSLTPNQVTAARASVARVAAKREERAAAKAGMTGGVSMAAIEAMFAAAGKAGLQRPRFVTARLDMALASPYGKNPGAVYVKCDGVYAGKIAAGTFSPGRDAPADILALVREVAADPIESARKFGRATGKCACCGRKLTDAKSIAAGIGPICEAKWF